MSEVQGSTVATTSDVPATQAEGTQPITSEPANPQTTGTGESEQEHTEQQTEEQRKSKFQRRLERHKTRAVQAETEARMLRERLAELEGRSKTQAPPETGKEPKREDFESYEDFIAARAEHRAEKKAQELIDSRLSAERETRTREQAQREQQALAKTWGDSLEKARDEIDDYDEVTSESEAPTTPTMSRAIMESDIGAKLVYHLAKHPEEAERIAKLSPVRQIAEIGKLEDKVSQAKPAPKKPSSAPEPITPVTGRASADANALDDRLSSEEWLKRRNAQLRKRQ